MMLLRYCNKCKEYTLQTICPRCGEKTINPHPPRFSPEDKYGVYRRKLKKQQKRGG